MEDFTSAPFIIGDYVIYKTYGICTIDSIDDQDFGNGSRKYFTLKLVNPPQSVFYVPCDLENLEESMRHTISKEEIISSIAESETFDEIWNPDNKRRTQDFELILMSGTTAQKLYVYKVLNNRKKETIITKKKMYICDSRTLSTVEKLIKQEFSFVLSISEDEVLDFIENTKNNIQS